MTEATFTVERSGESVLLKVSGRVSADAIVIHQIIGPGSSQWSESLTDDEYDDAECALVAAVMTECEDAERDAGEQDAEWEDE
jgi:hypothetical protein